jgi:hypothetical protein
MQGGAVSCLGQEEWANIPQDWINELVLKQELDNLSLSLICCYYKGAAVIPTRKRHTHLSHLLPGPGT